MSPFNANSSMKRTRAYLIFIWILSAVLAGPFLYLYKFRYLPDRELGLKPYCTTHNPTFKVFKIFQDSSLYKNILNLGSKYFASMREFYGFITMLYQFLLPLIYLSYAYIKMMRRLRRSDEINEHVDDETSISNKRRSIKMMIVVVFSFGFCWFPWHLFSTIQIVWHNFNK